MDDFNKYTTAFDPCPQCGAPVEAYEARPEYVRSNPDSVMSIRDPDCPHESDPEADCTCTSYINSAPNPMLDRMVQVGAWFTFSPCGHQFEQSQKRGWKVTRTVNPGWHQAQLDQLVADAAEHGVPLRVPQCQGLTATKGAAMSNLSEQPSYHDLHITTAGIPRTSIFNLPYGLEVSCNRVTGWCLWQIHDGDFNNSKQLAGEYAENWLILDVAGHVILNSRDRDPNR